MDTTHNVKYAVILSKDVREASRAVGLSSNGAQISKVCNGKAKTAKKLHWEFVK